MERTVCTNLHKFPCISFCSGASSDFLAKLFFDTPSVSSFILQVRNLCYMISRREKERRRFYKTRQEVFNKQLQVILSMNLSTSDLDIVIDANHSDTIYDNPKLWSFSHVSHCYCCIREAMTRLILVTSHSTVL